MNALVTGSSGFIGAALCKRLVSVGYNVTSADIANGFDVRSKSAVFEVVGDTRPDVIFHLASIATTQAGAQDPAACYAVNVGAVDIVLEAALGFKVSRVVVPSTYLPPTEPYSISKQLAANLCRLHRYRGAAVLTHCNVYGPGDPNKNRIVPGIISRILDGQCPVVKMGVARRFIFIDDLIECYLMIAASARCGNWVMHGDEVTLVGLAQMIISKINPGAHYRLTWGDNDHEPFVEPQDAQNVKHQISLDDGLDATIDWYEKQSRK